MSDHHNHLSAKDEALLILEYLENEHMSKTFLNFLDESKHLHQLRSRLYANYDHTQQNNTHNDNDLEVNDFQAFFNLSQDLVSQSTNHPLTFASNKTSNDLFFDDDFLNDLISQTPPMDYPQDLSDTPIVNDDDNDDDMNTIEQLFAVQHDTPSEQVTPSRLTSYTKCIVVTQDFLQSMYNTQSMITNNNSSSSGIPSNLSPKRRRRRLKIGKENYYQQRKIMPRTSPDHR